MAVSDGEMDARGGRREKRMWASSDDGDMEKMRRTRQEARKKEQED